jgi:hypothetical protein
MHRPLLQLSPLPDAVMASWWAMVNSSGSPSRIEVTTTTSAALRRYGKPVFQPLQSSIPLARAFVTANWVARKVVEHGGENGFLRTSELHTSVRRDFQDTDFGMVKSTSSFNPGHQAPCCHILSVLHPWSPPAGGTRPPTSRWHTAVKPAHCRQVKAASRRHTNNVKAAHQQRQGGTPKPRWCAAMTSARCWCAAMTSVF